MAQSSESPRDRFIALVGDAIRDGTLVKLTLGKAASVDPTLRNLFVRPVTLKSGPHLSFVWRHDTRDITKNHRPEEALPELAGLIGADFRDAHLFTGEGIAQLETQADGTARLHQKKNPAVNIAPAGHDEAKSYPIPADARWLRVLGVTNERGQPREGMRDKFRQIQKFAELLEHLLQEAFSNQRSAISGQKGAVSDQPAAISKTEESGGDQVDAGDSQERAIGDQKGAISDQLSAVSKAAISQANEAGQEESLAAGGQSQRVVPLRILDAGAGKGYLTFALAALLGERAAIEGVEARPALVELGNRVARECGLANLRFTAGLVGMKPFVPGTEAVTAPLDVLIALHACDTATDDALARGIAAGARLLVVAPCCQKELRPQLTAPPVLAEALRHGIFQERAAEFVTDALRAQLLEWAGYRTKVFEFISTEHTAKNLMIAAIKTGERGTADDERAKRIREFATFYGIERQALARQLGFELQAEAKA